MADGSPIPGPSLPTRAVEASAANYEAAYREGWNAAIRHAEAAAALRARPGREEVELRLRNLCGLFWLDGAYGNGNRRIPQIEQFLRDLGYGPEGAK